VPLLAVVLLLFASAALRFGGTFLDPSFWAEECTFCGEFRALDPLTVRSGAAVFDCWRLLPAERFAPGARYMVLGKGS